MPRRTRNATLVAAVSAAMLSGALVADAGAQTAGGSAASQYSPGTQVPTVAVTGRVDLVVFGTLQGDVSRDIQRALREGGISFRRLRSTTARTKAFAASPLANRLASGDAEALGRAVGAQLTSTSSVARQVFAALFGDDEPFRPLTRAILAPGHDSSASDKAFALGLAKGFASAGIITVYAEPTDQPQSRLSEFGAVSGVSTVGDINTENGRQRLVSLINGGSGTIGAKAPAATPVAAAPAASINRDDDGVPTGVYVGLGLAVAGAAAFAGTGAARRRRS